MKIHGYHIKTSLGLIHHTPPVLYYFKINADRHMDAMETVLPTVYYDIIFPLNLSIFLEGKNVPLEKPFVSPILKQGKKITLNKNSKVVGIRVDPLRAGHIFNTLPKDFLQGPNEYRDVVKNSYRTAIEAIVYGNSDFTTMVIKLNAFFNSIYHDTPGKDAVLRCLQQIKESPWTSVHALSEEMKWSTRWLEMQFQEYLGASPTEIIKIVRLNRFLNVLHKHKEHKLTRLALEAGYYDQSHLIRDFKNFSNMSPGNYKRSYPLISKVMNHL